MKKILNKKSIKFISLLISICFPISLPATTHAQIIIHEIMYDSEGTDAGHEWVEIYNSGTIEVDISGFKLRENDVDHKLTFGDGVVTMLPAQGYALIADKADVVLQDYPDLQGKVIDSVFSLNNEGETVSLITPAGLIEDTATYSVTMGAKGTGNSLQYKDGSFIPGKPTPGLANITEAINEAADNTDAESASSTNSSSSGSSGGSGSTSTHSSQTSLTTYTKPKPLKVGAGRDRYVSLRTPLKFEAVVDQSISERLNFDWVFGDGFEGRGRVIQHSYNFAGTYNVVLSGETKEENAVARISVHVVEPELHFEQLQTGEYKIQNKGKQEINVGGFGLKSDVDDFVFPQDTIISPQSSIVLMKDVVEWEEGPLSLIYPDQKVITSLTFSLEKPDKAILRPEAISSFCLELEAIQISCNISKIQEIFGLKEL